MITPPPDYKGKTYIGGRYVYEHRFLVEQKIGRLLEHGEIIDHINGNKLDNHLENLQILTPILHGKKHRIYKENNVRCKICGKGFRTRPAKKKLNKIFFCSRKHYRQYVKKYNSFRGKNILE